MADDVYNGRIRFAGWRDNDDERAPGNRRFVIEVEFDDGAPKFQIAAIMEQWPATVTVRDPTAESAVQVKSR